MFKSRQYSRDMHPRSQKPVNLQKKITYQIRGKEFAGNVTDARFFLLRYILFFQCSGPFPRHVPIVVDLDQSFFADRGILRFLRLG